MEPMSDYSIKDYLSDQSPIDETQLWNPLKENSSSASKNRRNQIKKTLDGLKVTPINYENLPVANQLKRRSSSVVNHKKVNPSNLSVLNNKIARKSAKQRSKGDSKISTTGIPRKVFPDHTLMERMGQESISEPTLIAKDRGDSISAQDMYREKMFKYFRDEKPHAPKNVGLKGCMYIKKAGKIYRCLIEAKDIEDEEDIGYYKSLGLNNCRCEMPLSYLKEGNYFNENATGYRTRKFRKGDEFEDFDVAIFLSGLKDVSSRTPKKRVKNKPESFTGIRLAKKAKKKRRNLQPSDASMPALKGKTSELDNQSLKSNAKMITYHQKIERRQPPKINYYDEVEDSDKFEMSGSELLYDIPEKEHKIKKWRQKSSVMNTSESVRFGGNENQIFQDFRNIRNDGSMSRLRQYQSSIYDFSNSYRMPKIKLKEDELWERFETIFKRYASTSRHAGEVIPRKISTEWMMNAGVVGEILSEKNADNAFRQAVGAKITMNAQEYKEFLIMLTLRMKLPYYEIYRRMCGI